MNEQQINEVLGRIHKGAFTKVVYKTILHSNKDYKEVEVTKIVEVVARFGVEYANMASVKQKMAQKAAIGQAASVHTLAWGSWKSDFLIENKGQTYVRLTCPKNNPKLAPKVIGYYANGKEITKAEAMTMTRASDWATKEDIDVYVKKIDDIISIGKKN